MASENPSCRKTYGVPLYCVSCVPLDRINIINNNDEDHQDQSKEQEIPKHPTSDRLFVALGGGGGEGHSGIPNAVVLSTFDFASRSLSDEPVFRLGMDGELPYRMAMHPNGDGFVCSFPKSCRLFEWDFLENKELLAMKPSEKILSKLEDVGQQLALAFNVEGSILATGGEDGHLRVFKWPSMEIILDQTDANNAIKDLDFSYDSKYLVSLWSKGPSRLWDLTSAAAAASLQREDGEMFGFCRFSQSSGENQMLYATAMHGKYGKIISWNVGSWQRVGSKKIVRDGISAFNVSPDGKLLAVGTFEGDVIIINSSNMQPMTTVKKAHLGIVTSLAFSQGSRVLLSASFDSTARVTLIEDKKKNGMNITLILLVLLFSFLVYYLLNQRDLWQSNFPTNNVYKSMAEG